jgi:hypothetical protein
VEEHIMGARLRTKDLTWQELDGEVVVLDLRSSTYFVVNGSGARLWDLLADEATLEELAGELRAAYALPADVATAHVEDFLRSLERSGLLDT